MDLASLVAFTFIGTEIWACEMNVSNLYDQVNDLANTTSRLTWVSVVEQNKTKYRQLVHDGLWPLNKTRSQTEIAGLKAAMKSLMNQLVQQQPTNSP